MPGGQCKMDTIVGQEESLSRDDEETPKLSSSAVETEALTNDEFKGGKHDVSAVKEAHCTDVADDHPSFGFVEVHVDQDQASVLSDSTSVDPLQLPNHPVAACKPDGARQELLFVDVKQEPGEPGSSSDKLGQPSHAELHNDRGISLSTGECSIRSVNKLGCNEGTHQQEGNTKFSATHVTASKLLYSGDMPYICEVCYARFSQNYLLTKHKRLHSGEKPYGCDTCAMRFPSSSNLANHKRVHSGERPYCCDVCSLKFKTNSQLTSHKRTHSGQKLFVCNECNARFSQNGHLITHKRLHSGEKPFPCDICEERFISSSHLTYHKKIHSGEKPYPCKDCKKTFKNSGQLTIHSRIHSGEKPFVCGVCQAKFSQNAHLKTHKRLHSGEKPFGCVSCGARFAHSHSFAKHKRLHCKGKPCDV